MENPTFTHMLEDHSGALRAFAYQMTRDSDDANDLYQDTLIKALRYYTQYQQGTNFKAWLFTIMRNTFINHYRREKRKMAVITVRDEITSEDLSWSGTKNTAEGKFVQTDIQRMLAQLPATYRIPFVRHFEGYKYHEIAEELDIPLGTVKTRIHAAREMLKKNLRPYASN